MRKTRNVEPANDDASPPCIAETRQGRVTFEDFSVEHMMASIVEHEERASTPRRN